MRGSRLGRVGSGGGGCRGGRGGWLGRGVRILFVCSVGDARGNMGEEGGKGNGREKGGGGGGNVCTGL